MCILVLEDVGSVRGRNSKEEWAHGSKSTGLAFHTLLMPGETSMPLMGINWNLQCRCLADDSACRTHNMSVQRTRPCLHNGQNRMLLVNFSPPGTPNASKGKNCTREPGSIILFWESQLAFWACPNHTGSSSKVSLPEGLSPTGAKVGHGGWRKVFCGGFFPFIVAKPSREPPFFFVCTF